MTLLYLMAEKYGTRPSEFIGIADKWAAYNFDAAVTMIGLEETRPDERRQPPGQGYQWQQG